MSVSHFQVQDVIGVKLLIISLLSVIAPVLSEQIKWTRVPSIVFELILGIIIGPQVLDLVQPELQIDVLARVGFTLLMFLAGYEIDLQKIKRSPVYLATVGWLVSLVLALSVAVVLTDLELTLNITIIALALTTTSLGVLLPIMQDNKILASNFGALALAIGTTGEFFPIFIISTLFSKAEPMVTVLYLAFFVTIAVGAALFIMKLRKAESVRFVSHHLHLSDQLPVRVSILLVLFLVCLAIHLGVDALLGSFSAGIVVRLFTAKKDKTVIDSKLKAIGFGFLIPLFFIVSGTRFDLHALASLEAITRMFCFLLCMLIVRGAPVFILYRKRVDRSQQQALAFFSATGLPLIVVIVQLGVMNGKMLPVNATALIGAGILSTLLFPLFGLMSLKKSVC